MTDERIKRFFVPTAEDLADLPGDAEQKEAVRAILTRWHDDRDFSYEQALQACDKALGTCGIESIDPEGAPHYTDEGIRLCPPFSYCNAGDTYIATLARDHKAGAWVVACWGDLLEELERDEELGDFEVFEECPEECPSCLKSAFTLEFFPGSGRGPSYSWVCDSCNHHAFAETLDGPAVKIGDTDDGETVTVVSRPEVGRFSVHVDGKLWAAPIGYGSTWETAQDAREAYERGKDGTIQAEDGDRCPHGMFYSGMGACPDCGRGAD